MSRLVYQAINAVSAELSEAGIAKRHRNEEGDYNYRSVEDVLNAIAPLLARHKLCVLPRIVDRESQSVAASTARTVIVRAEFDLVSALDGSIHTIESFGEAIDESDKGTAKAISAAYKSAMLQAFCIPVPQEDADARSPKLARIAVAEPPEGWDCWAREVIEITASCEAAEAIDRLCKGRKQLLAAVQRSRPDLYATIGQAIATRLAGLQQSTDTSRTKRPHKPIKRNGRKGAVGENRQPAEAA